MNNLERVVQDLNVGNTADAANVLRAELQHDPRHAAGFVNEAQQLTSPNSADGIIVNGNNVNVYEKATGNQVYAGSFLPGIIIDHPVHIPHPHRPVPMPHPYHPVHRPRR